MSIETHKMVIPAMPVDPENATTAHVIHPGYPELDQPDVSLYPSYTYMMLPYRVVCRQRYARNHIKHCKAFMEELMFLQRMQTRALDGVRINRQFSRGIISPVFRTLAQLQSAFPDTLTPEQRWRLEEKILRKR